MGLLSAAPAICAFRTASRLAVMPRIRILFMIDYLVDSGGAERFALGLATHLPSDRFELWMCSTRWAEPATAAALAEAGIQQLHLGRRSRWDVHRFAKLVALVRRERFDVIHAHMFGSNVWGSLIGRMCRVPVVIAHEHTWSYEGHPLRKWIDGHLIGRLVTRFVAVSSFDAERMVSIEGVPAEKVVTLAPGYVPRPRSADGDLRGELGIDGDTPLVAVVAELRPQKALSVLLEAFVLVLELVSDAHLAIAGDGECMSELQEQAVALGLQDRIHFLGRRTDVDSILGASDVAAMSSDYEGTPLVAYECFANHTPLVATAVGGLPDIIDDGRTGVLVAPREPAALADALVGLLLDPVRRDRIADAATERLDEFTIDAVARRFAALYTMLLDEVVVRSRVPVSV
jgi:glycosyltransferase involved in cell wall biosynthesis